MSEVSFKQRTRNRMNSCIWDIKTHRKGQQMAKSYRTKELVHKIELIWG